MLLAIDAGNTNTVFAVINDKEVKSQWRSSTKEVRTADEHFVWLSHLMTLNGIKQDDIDAAIISTVVPQSLFNLRSLCRNYFELEPLVIGDTTVDLGIKILAKDVGADRLVNAVAAHKTYGGPLIVIDFGTATTFDVISVDGDYEGGVIAPGINTSLEALHLAAAKLPRIEVARPQRVIGDGTIPAMQSGTFWGYVGLIEGLVARIRAEYDRPMKVIATGGLASLFRNSTDVIEQVDQDLTIRGLLEIHQKNTGKL